MSHTHKCAVVVVLMDGNYWMYFKLGSNVKCHEI